MTTLPWGRELTPEDLVGQPFGDARVELVDGSLLVTREGGFSTDELDGMPEDGHRYELLDGAILVTPSPTGRHQLAHSGLMRSLLAACPAHLRVLSAPLDLPLAERTTLQPDLMVIRSEDMHGPRQLPHAPLLVVEILSPSTRRFDLGEKLHRYQRARTPSYWVVDPQVPRLMAWELHDDAYVEVADVSGEDSWTATSPYDLTLRPSELVR